MRVPCLKGVKHRVITKHLVLMLPAFILTIIFVYIPIIRGVGLAFQKYNLFDLSNTGFYGLENFRQVILNPHVSFIQILGNTLVWIAGSLGLQFILGFSLALLLKKPFRGRGVYSSFVFYTWALSGFAIGLAWSWILAGQFGMVNDLLIRAGIIGSPIGFLSNPRLAMFSVIGINVWYGIPFFTIMLLAALQSIPKEIYESAEIDGASKARQLFSITIPYVRPTIVSTTLLRSIWIMNSPEIIFGTTSGGPVNSTNTLSLYMVKKVLLEYDYGQGAAISVIILVVLLILSYSYISLTSAREIRL